MIGIIILAAAFWAASALIRAGRRADEWYAAQERDEHPGSAYDERISEIRREREQMRQRREADRQDAKRLLLDQKIALAEPEIEFNRGRIDDLMELLSMQELERDACTRGSSYWQKYQKKALALKNQIHTAQRRLDKAKIDKYICEQRMEA